MSDSHWLKRNFVEAFSLPESAVDWLLMVWDAIQVFDDVADGQPVERKDLDRVIWASFVGLAQNPFFRLHSLKLLPVLETQIFKWQASDKAERNGQADARSYAWRAGYYDLVLMVINLVHGPDVAADSSQMVMNLYGESIENYMKEFKHA